MKLNKFIFLILLSFTTIHPQFIKKNPSINADQEVLRKHINILGSDQFEGRGTGTKGGELAASYIASEFRSIGLMPLGDNGSYFQDVPLHGTSVLDNSYLKFFTETDTSELIVGKDYVLISLGEESIIPKPVQLVFVGYGIIAPEYDHNDYLNKDVNGKIAVMLSGEPESNSLDYFNGDEPTLFSYSKIKHRIALSRGAEGIIIIPRFSADDSVSWKKLENEYSFEDVKLPYAVSENFGIIINPRIAKKFFVSQKEHEKSVLNLQTIQVAGYKMKFEGNFFNRDFIAKNVIGLIESENNSENEFIIVSAHYDHLGIGPPINNDRIYNGVLDNAIGVATMIEVARNLVTLKGKINRSIIFLATTGEEKGLLGSTYYTDHPIKPLYKTVANINIDGAPYIDDFNSIIGIGSSLSNLKEILIQVAKKINMEVSTIPKEFYSTEAFNRSDQIAFSKAGIPSILILDAPNYTHLSYNEGIQEIIDYDQHYYHTPFDDLNIKIDYNATAKYTKLISTFIMETSNYPYQIKWNKNVPFNSTRLQTIAEER